jgi:hypothetical protein
MFKYLAIEGADMINEVLSEKTKEVRPVTERQATLLEFE